MPNIVPTIHTRLAVISLDVLKNNSIYARQALYTQEDARVDLRADAFGHGLEQVARVAYAAGWRRCLVSREQQKGLLEQLGFEVTVSAEPLEPQTPEVYGFSAVQSKTQGAETAENAENGTNNPKPTDNGKRTEAAPAEGITPALTLHSCLLLTKRIPAGTGVSYSWTYRSGVTENVGIIGLGYADGIPFQSPDRVRVSGKNYPVIGRIAMDHTVIRLDQDEPEPEQSAIIWGDGREGEPTAASWAAAIGVSPLALTSRLANRVEKHWI